MRTRSANITDDQKSKMKELADGGMRRTEIAKQIPCHPSAITRHLGSVRVYVKKKTQPSHD